jgi:hypothetical protein
METVNFQCGHCGQLMGVGADHLGQQVRCPHCQQVVVAPAMEAAPPVFESPSTPAVNPSTSPPAVTLAPDMEFHVPSPVEQESIFSEPAATGDDLFGAEPASKVEMPPEPAVPHLQLDEGVASNLSTLAKELLEEPTAQGDVTATFEVPVFLGPPAPAHTNGASDPALGSGTLWSAPSSIGSSAESPSHESSTTNLPAALTTPTVRMPQKARAWVLPLLIVPLISYSVLMTIAVGILYLRLQQQVHPLEAIPDQGDNKGATHKGSSSIDRMPNPEQDLPSRLRVELGHSLRVGDIEVTPVKIAHRQIQFQEGPNRDPTKQPTLALELRIRNVSDDVYFKPLDPYFNRHWNPNKPSGMKPYSFLTVDSKRFFGPLPWQPRSQARWRMSVVGQDLDKELKPGEEMTTFICTDPQDSAPAALKNAKGPFVWRIHVRRGLVKVGDKEVSATAVVGVEFNKQDVQ